MLAQERIMFTKGDNNGGLCEENTFVGTEIINIIKQQQIKTFSGQN